ncbi:glycine-rich RNA-binding protein 2, mitochondrial-like [Aristolochia californica]|uniref:glycine-rich RNA-binding protein 2, mitochondrial-like n=1 Tax=Aristolochia californica TaxID=171875 RepID=UPI0035D94698
MAFCSRIGGLVRQSVASNSVSAGPASMLNAIRAMSSAKLFVGGLSWGTDDQTLRDAFTSFGDVVEARVITDRDTGRSRGFGFVNFATTEAATAALGMDGQELHGRNIRVNYANDRPSGGFRGGYGGGGGYGDGDAGGSF